MTYYLYRHIRHDKDEPFYIGIGTIHAKDSKSEKNRYKRAFSSSHRNKLWRGVVKKTNFDVEIVFESDNRDEIVRKEIEFIKLYGRKDFGNGVLCNLTDGGEGTLCVSEDVKKIISKKNRENGCFERNGKWLAERNRTVGSSWKGRRRPDGYFGYKPKYVYSQDGLFIKKFDSNIDAAEYCGVKSVSITSGVRDNAPRNGYYFFNQYMGDVIEIEKKKRGKVVYKIDPSNGVVVDSFDSCTSASMDCGIKNNTLCIKISGKIIHNGFAWSYSEKININEYSKLSTVFKVNEKPCVDCGGEKELGRLYKQRCGSCNSTYRHELYVKNKSTK